MAQAEQTGEQCKALTASGDRCSRDATEDGFCHQHNESDDTVSEAEQQDGDEQSQEAVETTDPDEVDVQADVDDERIEAVMTIRQTVHATAGDLIGRPFDGVTEITAAEEGWRAVVEVVERRAVPDTQDVIGRYEIELDEDGTIEGYRRIDRYRRGDTTSFEERR